jgi:ATP-dependent Clp protease ATP-binding subunit ClpA
MLIFPTVFERYTEKARRAVFFSRYEASQFGSPYIETEHLLLGLLRENQALTNRFLRQRLSVEEIRKQIQERTLVRERISTSVDLPLSNECKRVLGYAAEEAESLGDKHIGTEHLLLGLLREEKSFAAELLRERGLQLESVRENLKTDTHTNTRQEQPRMPMAPEIRFINPDRSLLCLGSLGGGLSVPRVGEYITLDFGPDVVKYRVVNVTHHYQSQSGAVARLDILEIMVTVVDDNADNQRSQ